jgi:hypothetical protein
MSYQIMGLGVYRQNVGAWSTQDYTFGNQSGAFEKIGCTPTAITNILVWVANGLGLTAPDPSNTNKKDSVFWNVFDQTKFKDLSYQNNKLESGLLWRVKIDLFKSPIEQSSESGGRLKERIKQSIRAKKPVLLGIRGNNAPRHSIVAAGIDKNDEIWVVDPWTAVNELDNNPNNDYPKNPQASFAPLSLINSALGGYHQFDMAFEASRDPHPVPNPQPGPRRPA